MKHADMRRRWSWRERLAKLRYLFRQLLQDDQSVCEGLPVCFVLIMWGSWWQKAHIAKVRVEGWRWGLMSDELCSISKETKLPFAFQWTEQRFPPGLDKVEVYLKVFGPRSLPVFHQLSEIWDASRTSVLWLVFLTAAKNPADWNSEETRSQWKRPASSPGPDLELRLGLRRVPVIGQVRGWAPLRVKVQPRLPEEELLLSAPGRGSSGC